MAEWYSSSADILIHENITFPEKFIVSFVTAKKRVYIEVDVSI